MAREAVKVVWHWVARSLCQGFCLLFFRVRIFGRHNIPARGGFILAGNHQSFLDPVFCGIGTTRRLLYMARDSLFRSPLFSWLIRSVNTIPLSRDKADFRAMKLVISRLTEGHGVCLFPEGTRSHDGRITAFKPGFGLLCRRSGAIVVPTLIDGAFECWPRHRKLFTSGRIVVGFGRPLRPEEIRKMSNEELADCVTQTLRQMQQECHLKQGEEPCDYTV